MNPVNDPITEASVRGTAKHLALDSLIINPRLARRLPPAVAFRYHALPLAEDKSRITVAMADPDDKKALEAVTTALGRKPYVVQSDLAAIDSLLAEIWPQEICAPTRLLVYDQASSITGQVQAYARYLSALISSHLTHFQSAETPEASFNDLTQAARGYDLVIFGEPDQSIIERLLAGPAELKASQQMPGSVLIARQPRWPLRRMLLILRGQETDAVAVDWIARLAQPSQATVTVLALVSPMPAACDQVARMQHGLAQWLASDTALGQQLRQIAQRLVNWETRGTLRFRQGPADWQIQREVAEGDYDLIVIAGDQPGRRLRRLQGDLVSSLLHWANQPVLVAKPTTE